MVTVVKSGRSNLGFIINYFGATFITARGFFNGGGSSTETPPRLTDVDGLIAERGLGFLESALVLSTLAATLALATLALATLALAAVLEVFSLPLEKSSSLLVSSLVVSLSLGS
jgi:hypothetical protein